MENCGILELDGKIGRGGAKETHLQGLCKLMTGVTVAVVAAIGERKSLGLSR